MESFGVKKSSLDCCSEMLIVESSAEDPYVLDNYAPMKFQPGKTRNEVVAKNVHETLSFEITKFDAVIDLNYIAFSCNFVKKENVNVVCFYNPSSVNKQYFLKHFEILLEGCCQMTNCFLVGDMNIDLLKISAIGNKYSNSSELNGR